MSDDTTSSGASGIPASETPVIGTPATGETPGTTQPPNDVLKEMENLRAALKKANADAADHRKKLSAYEKIEKEQADAKKAADEAQLSEIDRTNKKYAELQAQHEAHVRMTQERIVRYEVEMQAAKLGIKYPQAAAKLLDWSELEYEEDGTPKNADKLLEKLLKSMPELGPGQSAEPAPTTPAQTAAPARPHAPAVPPFAGRSSIPSPNAQTSSKPFTLDQYEWKR